MLVLCGNADSNINWVDFSIIIPIYKRHIELLLLVWI